MTAKNDTDRLLPVLEVRTKLHQAVLEYRTCHKRLRSRLVKCLTSRFARNRILMPRAHLKWQEQTVCLENAIHFLDTGKFRQILEEINLADDFIYKLTAKTKDAGILKLRAKYQRMVSEFVAQIQPFLAFKTKAYAHVNCMTKDDASQEAVFGLLKAMQKFDPSRGIKFVSMAEPWILQSAQRAYIFNYSNIRIPYKMSLAERKIDRFISEYRGKHSKYPDDNVILKECKINQRELNVFKEFPKMSFTLNSPSVAGELDETIQDTVQNPGNPDVLEDMEADYRKTKVLEALELLDPRSKKMLEMRFGFDNKGGDIGFREVGTPFGVSRERARQIESESLKKLKDSGLLKEFMGEF